jgi:hypothetical protein
MYDTATGKRIEAVPHPELRNKQELARARAAKAPKQPSGKVDPDFNPIRAQLAAHVKLKGPAWAKSDDGRKYILEREHESDEFDRQRAEQRKADEFAASIADLVGHATKQVQAVLNDSAYSVEQCEHAMAALEAAKRGDRDGYIAWERSHHERLTQALAEKLADKEIDLQKLRAERDTILKSSLNYTPEPVPEIRQPEPTIPVDRSHVAIRDKQGRTTIESV